MAHGKSIELFLANGTADSLIIAELSNWNGKAIKIPRIEVTECKRDDIKGAGVYFLFCKEEDDTDSVYIGESETVQDRLIQHLRDYNAEKEKFYWTTAVIFLGRDLNKALIRYLEDRFVQIARECKRYTVLTKNTYTIVRRLITEKEYVELLIGRDGEFDQIVSSTVRRAKRDIRDDNSELIWVMAYLKAEYANNADSFDEYYDRVEVCDEAARSHPKSAIQIRNRNMVDRSDLVICYIDHQSGGAFQTMQYALKRGKKVINLAEEDTF